MAFGVANRRRSGRSSRSFSSLTAPFIDRPADPFKGVAEVASQENEYDIIKNRNVEVILRDPNGQEVEKLDLKTNGYGSLSGSFTAFENRLTGHYSVGTKHPPHGQTGFRSNTSAPFSSSWQAETIAQTGRDG